MISKKESRPFLVKRAIGGIQTNKENTIYEDEWQITYGIIGDPSGSAIARIYGIEETYDKIIVMDATELTRSIEPTSIILVENMPTENYYLGDYDIARIYPEKNGIISIGLNKRESVDLPRIYYYNGENILYFQLNFDIENNVGYVLRKNYLPFAVGDYIWTREPDDDEDTSYRFVFTEQNQVGFDDRYQPFYELVFEEE